MKVHFVHGILDPYGTAGLLRLVPYFSREGFDCRVPDYGLITAVEARVVNPIIENCLAPYIEQGDVYVGHSNGCAVGYELMAQGAPLSVAVLINAALERSAPFLETTAASVDVYYNEGDDATVAAEVGRRLGLVSPVWGDMGHAGYAGHNSRVTNIDCGRPSAAPLPPVSGHSDIFEPGKLELWAPYIVQRVKTHLHLT